MIVGMVQWIDRVKQVKFVLILIAVVIAILSLGVSHFLVQDLSREEKRKMEVWAEAMRTLNNASADTDLNLVLTVINGNHTIPVIVVDNEGEVQTFRNISISAEDTLAFLKKKAVVMRSSKQPIRIQLNEEDETDYIEICYDESLILKRLASYPYVQLGVVLVFVLVAIFALLSSKKAEQNRVWVGLSKETAHQLGTPISSLMAWMEILREKYIDDELIPEMSKDVARLRLIADRFSKIGSMPELKEENLNEVLGRVVAYIERRCSSKVMMICQLVDKPLMVKINASLFEWVIENLCKNSIDAMNGQGTIMLRVEEHDHRINIEVEDTGKGIAKSNYKNVFTPGYTTKKRGWGLGLSLAKRIVEEYHRGRIYVRHSELNKGTIFRIELKK
ncbi:MAG: HAMP domain-containing histidine kinase [Bacteroidaceae bacterium]|nr:HAMP domain-containing histidine kinase [Bacteroidaceae bacterium]